MKKIEKAKLPPTNADLAKKYKNMTKTNYNPKDTSKDYGYKYDDQPPGFVPKPTSTFDNVNSFDNMISKIFSY